MSTLLYPILQITVIAYAVIAGVFLAFSDFIMRALAHTGGVGGVEAMQTINREVFRWVFMVLFLGLAPVSLFLLGYGAMNLDSPSGAFIAAAGIIYLIGCFLVTIVFNVPMNEALAEMDLGAEATKDYWTAIYLPRWTFWNSVRTGACVVASAALLLGLVASA